MKNKYLDRRLAKERVQDSFIMPDVYAKYRKMVDDSFPHLSEEERDAEARIVCHTHPDSPHVQKPAPDPKGQPSKSTSDERLKAAMLGGLLILGQIVVVLLCVLIYLVLFSDKAHAAGGTSQIDVITISDGTTNFVAAAPFHMNFSGCSVAKAGSTATITCTGTGGGSGTVTSVGDLSPLFTTATRTTTPAFSLTAAAAHAILGNNTVGSAAPTYFVPACASLSDAGAFCNGTSYANLTSVPSTFAPTAHNLLSASHGDTTASAAVRGGGVFALGASPTWTQVAHSAATGGYFKWNGTDQVASTGAAAGTGSCTNQFVSAENADAAPTCTTATLSSAQFANQGTVNTILHGNASGNPAFSAVDVSSADITGVLKASAFPALTGPVTTVAGALATTIGASAITDAMLANPYSGVGTPTACTNQFVTGLTLTRNAAPTSACTTDVLASAQHANQGTTTTLLHGNAAGNPAFGSVVQGDVTNGYVDLSSTQASIAGTKTFTGLTNLTNVNSRVMCDQSTGATFDAKVNACIATVIAAGGGIADATGLTGTQTHTAEVDIGNGSSIPVTLLLSPSLTDQVTMTTAGACALKVFDGSRLIGTQVGITHQAIIKNGSVTTNTGSLICTNDGAGTGQYITIQGLMVYNQGGTAGTFTKGLVFIKNIFDTSSVRDMVITNEASGDGLVVEAACCASLFFNIQSDGSHTAGSRPCVFKSITGDLQPMNGVAFQNMSCVHPGSGLSAVTIQHTYTSTANPCSIAFTGLLYIEGNSTDTTTPLLNNDSCTALYIQAMTVQFRSVTSTAVPINVTHTSVAGINPVTSLTQGVIQNSPQTFPATFLNDSASSITVKTDSQGVAGYLGYPLTFISQTPAGIGDVRFTPNTSVGLHIRVNLNNLNPLRLEDSTLSARAIDLGPNVTSTGTFGIRDATGPKNLLSLSWVSPFTATFAGPVSTGATCTAGTGGMYCGTEGTAAAVLAATDMFYADSTAHLFKASYNGGPFGAMINTDAQASIVADSAAINTTDTVIVKSAALAANRLLAGSVIRIVLDGTCTSTVGNVSTFTIRWGTNGTTADGTIAAVATSVAATSGTTNPFHTELLLTVRTAGASATSDVTGELASQGNIGIVATPNAFFVAGTAFNSTTASGILSVSYKSAATTTTSTFRNAFIEVVHQ